MRCIHAAANEAYVWLWFSDYRFIYECVAWRLENVKKRRYGVCASRHMSCQVMCMETVVALLLGTKIESMFCGVGVDTTLGVDDCYIVVYIASLNKFWMVFLFAFGYEIRSGNVGYIL